MKVRMNAVRLSGAGVPAKAWTNPRGTKTHLTLETNTAVARRRASERLALSLIEDPAPAPQAWDGICTMSGWAERDNKRRNSGICQMTSNGSGRNGP